MADYKPVSFNSSRAPVGMRALQCPECEHDHLHQEGVGVFVRNEEDSKDGLTADVNYADTDVVISSNADTDNPSSRRDGIVIRFSCEMCSDEGEYHELVIRQHKGVEHVGWRM